MPPEEAATGGSQPPSSNTSLGSGTPQTQQSGTSQGSEGAPPSQTVTTKEGSGFVPNEGEADAFSGFDRFEADPATLDQSNAKREIPITAAGRPEEKPQEQQPPVEQPQPQQQPPGEAAQRAAPTPQDVIAAIEQQTEQVFREVEQRFALSPQDIEALETNAPAIIPNLLSRAYLNAVNTSLRYIQTLVPSMVESQVNVMAAQMNAERAFFEAFPNIERKYEKDIIDFARAFRQVNPQIDVQTLIQQVGNAVIARHGLYARGNGAAPQAPAAFMPPVGGARGGVGTRQQAAASEGMFDGMGRDYDD